MTTIEIIVHRPVLATAYRMLACARRWRQRGNPIAFNLYLAKAAKYRAQAAATEPRRPLRCPICHSPFACGCP